MDIKKFRDNLLKEEIEKPLEEMAKIQGELKSAIERVIKDNPELEGLALKKAIKANPDVISALEVPGDIPQTIYDNQLNKFIALTKGTRTLQQRGRKPKLEPQNNSNPITSELDSLEDEDVWDNDIESQDVNIDNSIDSSTSDEGNRFKNIIIKKVQKIQQMDDLDRLSSPDLQALKQFIKKPKVVKELGRDLIDILVSPIMG